jgi:hypothetical protein
VLSTEGFYAEFEAAGWLNAATWQPSIGGPVLTAQVRLTVQDATVLGGDQRSNEWAMQYPARVFPELRRNEVVTISGTDYRVREDPHPVVGDGTELEVPLTVILR